MRGLQFIVLVAACGSDHSTTIKCGTGTQGTLAVGTPITVTAGDDLTGASIAAEAATTIPAASLTIACASDIVPAGYVALGPAVSFGAEATWSDRPFDLTVPYKMARMPTGGVRGNVRIVAQHPNGTPYFPAVTNRVLDDSDTYASRATFRSSQLTTYQVVAATNAGQTETQTFAWNAIIGVSMGGNAAMSIGLRHPDRFDVIADLGGEPGPSMVYSLNMVQDFLFGGFCNAADQAAGRGNIGTLCPNVSTKPEQFELASDFEHMVTQSGEGVGLTLDRSLYMKASRDLGRRAVEPRALQPDQRVRAAGRRLLVLRDRTRDTLRESDPLHDFYDREFNPDGSKPVITFSTAATARTSASPCSIRACRSSIRPSCCSRSISTATVCATKASP